MTLVVTAESIVSTVSQKTSLANPASVSCGKVGGNLAIMTNGAGGQYGLCSFEDNQACEEWALMRGQCPVGGVKTTGFDNVAQQYCAWVGGQTLAVPDSQCILPDGQVGRRLRFTTENAPRISFTGFNPESSKG